MANINDIYTFSQLNDQINKLINDLVSACDDLRTAGREWAKKENDYRRAKAIGFLQMREGTIPEKQARVDQACEQERLLSHIAEAEREACLERVRSLRAILSAYQTLARTNETEAQLSGLPQPAWTKPNGR